MQFFKEIAEYTGHHPSTLYSLAKMLNDIASPFAKEGVMWISKVISNNPDYIHKKLKDNTVYYIETFLRKYIFSNRDKIKRTKLLKNNIIIILDFLVEKNSTVGYMLRESII
jgi:hypothetical protein